jgi:hypothetical protein
MLALAFTALTSLAVGVGNVTPASASPDFMGILSSGKPDAPPFVFSPNFMSLSGGPVTITFTIEVKNLTNSPQTVTLLFGVHHIVTYYGQDVSDGQPGKPGITFKKGDSLQTAQILAAPSQLRTVTVPAGSTPMTLTFTQAVSSCGYYQVDVGRHYHRTHENLSAGFTRVLGCSQRLTPGFWKTHSTATTPLLPQSLGGYSVTTFAEAVAVFTAMKCNNPADCLAGHLLAAELDVASGSSPCISSSITAANAFLSGISYAGPGHYPLSAAQKASALSLAATLDGYTNDSTSFIC